MPGRTFTHESGRPGNAVFTYFLPYFLRNFSTLPAVSIYFCFPVKKGWHFEQIPTFMFSFVERVCITSPQAQEIVVSTYSGWIPFFINSLTTFANLAQFPINNVKVTRAF